jgi:hypothetical protein
MSASFIRRRRLEADFSIGFLLGDGGHPAPPKAKKADVTEHREVFHHVGVLVNEPPGMAGLPFN